MTTFNFAHQVISNLDSQINAVSNEIAELEQHLAKLRDAQKRIENERQAMLTLAKAGESALEQAANFLNMAKAANRVDMIEAFWNGIDSLRDERPQLTAWEQAEAEIMATEPNQPIDPTEGVIPETSDTEAEAIDVTSDVVAEALDEKPAYHSLAWREFLRYAKSQGINTRGKTRAEIELELLSQGHRVARA